MRVARTVWRSSSWGYCAQSLSKLSNEEIAKLFSETNQIFAAKTGSKEGHLRVLLKGVREAVNDVWFYQAWAKGDDEQQTYHASNKGSGEQWFHVHITAGSESSDGTGGWSYVPSVGAATSHFSEGTSGVGLLGPVVREDRLFDSTGMQGRGLPTRI